MGHFSLIVSPDLLTDFGNGWLFFIRLAIIMSYKPAE